MSPNKNNQPKGTGYEQCSTKQRKTIIGAIKIDKKEVQEHMDKLVRESVEEVLNELLNAEADALCNASRFERSPDYLDT